jgi:hypothetical protein
MREPRYKLYDNNKEYICMITLKEIIFLWNLKQDTTLKEANKHIKKTDNYYLEGAL